MKFHSYMEQVHDEEVLIDHYKAVVEDREVDTLVGTGLSGVLAITKLATAIGIDYLAVRKENDGSHSSSMVEGDLGSKWMFVDDFVSTGTTFKRVYSAVTDAASRNRHKTKFVGGFLYERPEFREADSFSHMIESVQYAKKGTDLAKLKKSFEYYWKNLDYDTSYYTSVVEEEIDLFHETYGEKPNLVGLESFMAGESQRTYNERMREERAATEREIRSTDESFYWEPNKLDSLVDWTRLVQKEQKRVTVYGEGWEPLGTISDGDYAAAPQKYRVGAAF